MSRDPERDTAAPAAPPRCCRNCSEPLAGRFCAACGQEDVVEDPTFGHIVRDFLGDLFDLDSRLWLTLKLLFSRPGFLSAEYLAGRRARYIAPLRLYLISSLVFFSAVATARVRIVQISGSETTADSVAGAEAARASGVAGDDAPRGPMGAALQVAGAQPDRLNQQFIRALAWVMFILIPVFALLLKGLYGGRGLLYVHHLVFALHFHAFGFLTQALSFAAVRFTEGPPVPRSGVRPRLRPGLERPLPLSRGSTVLRRRPPADVGEVGCTRIRVPVGDRRGAARHAGRRPAAFLQAELRLAGGNDLNGRSPTPSRPRLRMRAAARRDASRGWTRQRPPSPTARSPRAT